MNTINNENENNGKDIQTESLLEERIERFRELFEEKLKAQKNYAIIIITLLSLIGISAFYNALNTVVEKTAKNAADEHLDKILTDNYIEEKIKSRSEKTIKKLTDEYLDKILTDNYIEEKIKSHSEKTIKKLIKNAEDKARVIFAKTVNFSQWVQYGSWAIQEKKFEYGITCYENAIKQIPSDYKVIDGYELPNAYLTLVECSIITNNYEKAKKYLGEYESRFKFDEIEKYNGAIFYFYKIIIKKIQNENIDELNTKLDNLLKKKPSAAWRFDETQKWMKKALKQEDILYLNSKIKLISDKSNKDSSIGYIK